MLNSEDNPKENNAEENRVPDATEQRDKDDDLELEPRSAQETTASPPEVAEDINEIWLRNQRALAENDQSFSVAELLIAITVGAGIMTLVRLLPQGTAAATLGLLVLLGLIAGAFGMLHRLARLSVWMMLILYLLISAVAIFKG